MPERPEPPGDIYGFGYLLLWLIAVRAPSLADQVFMDGPARRRSEHATVNGHSLPTQALIAWLIAAAELKVPPDRIAEFISGDDSRRAEIKNRQRSLSAMVGRAMLKKPHLFRAAWLQYIADACGFTAEDLEILANGRDEKCEKIDYKVLRAAVESADSERYKTTAPPADSTEIKGTATASVTRALPPDIEGFAGREPEIKELARGITQDAAPRVWMIDGMAGSGKSTLAIHFAHLFGDSFPDGCFHVRLFGHSRERRAVPALDALSGLLRADGVLPQGIPRDVEQCALLWRERMSGRRMILLLDDAASPRQVLPLLPGTPRTSTTTGSPGSLVLITSRRRLASLPGTGRITIGTLPDEDAARLFVHLAQRPGLTADDPQVREIIRLCAYLPQAISLAAGHLKQRRGTITGLITALAVRGTRLAVLVGEHESIAAAFELSYRNLPSSLRRTFRGLGLHPALGVDPWTTAVLTGNDLTSARTQLGRLADCHLIERSAADRYQLHDLVAEHASVLAEDDPEAQRTAARLRLLDYYLHMARAADRFLSRRTPTWAPAIELNCPAHTPELRTRQDAAAWLDVNYPGVLAAAEYAAAHGQPDYVMAIASAMHGFLVGRSHWREAISLHRAALAAARSTRDQAAVAASLTDLGAVQYMSGDVQEALASINESAEIQESLADPLGQAHALRRRGALRFTTGEYADAEEDMTTALALYQQAGDARGKAETLTHLGSIQYETGNIEGATARHSAALEQYTAMGSLIGQADALAYLGLVLSASGKHAESLASHERAIELYRQDADPWHLAGGLYYLGGAQRAAGALDAAMTSLNEALGIFRQAGDFYDEAGVLNQIGQIQQAHGEYANAAASLNESLELYQRFGSENGEAEVCNSLGDLALEEGDTEAAIASYRGALAIAQDKHVGHEEPRALEGIGRCLLQQPGQRRTALAKLRTAKRLYEQLGSPHAARVAALLPKPKSSSRTNGGISRQPP